jgi:hypothetical protein
MTRQDCFTAAAADYCLERAEEDEEQVWLQLLGPPCWQHLTKLELGACSSINSRGLGQLLKCCPRLVELGLGGCSNSTSTSSSSSSGEGLAALRDLTRLQVLRLAGHRSLTAR